MGRATEVAEFEFAVASATGQTVDMCETDSPYVQVERDLFHRKTC
jgi:hypothetical protein